MTPVAVRPRPVACMTEHEHRSRAVADGVLAGRFTVAGETRELGPDPDWLGATLPDDEEWRIEWVKFGWGLDLAHAAAETGDDSYAEAWERLTAAWIRRVPPDHDAAEVTARRVLNWIYAWQALALGPEHAARLLESLAAQVGHVRAHLAPARNHRTLELYALLIAALALPELDRDGLLELAVSELDANLATDFHPDGVHREASTHYHLIALRSFVGALDNARRHGIVLPAGYEARLSRACTFAAHCRRPDGTIPALSDADTGDYRPLLRHAGELLGHEGLLHAGGAAGRPFTERSPSFPAGGYHVQRSGWDARARFLIFDCGPLGDGGHGHYDLLSFEAHGDGVPLVLDPGRGSYSESPPNLRRWFRGTAAHNTVAVDGLDQTPYTRGRPRGAVGRGRLLARRREPGLDVLAGEAVSPAYEAVHERRIAFVRERFWVIEDRLRGTRPHRYDLRFHLAPGAARLEGRAVRTGGLALVVLGGAEPVLEQGWIAPRYGELLEAPVVRATAHGHDARFVSVLMPGVAVPDVRIDGDRVRVDGEAIAL